MDPAMYWVMDRNVAANDRGTKPAMVAAWPVSKVLEVLGTRLAMSAMRGTQQPMTLLVIERMEKVA